MLRILGTSKKTLSAKGVERVALYQSVAPLGKSLDPKTQIKTSINGSTAVAVQMLNIVIRVSNRGTRAGVTARVEFVRLWLKNMDVIPPI